MEVLNRIFGVVIYLTVFAVVFAVLALLVPVLLTVGIICVIAAFIGVAVLATIVLLR